MMEFLDLLRDQHPFDQLSVEELERAQKTTSTEVFPAESVLLKIGDQPSSCLYLIASGTALLQRPGLPDTPLEEGDFFGHPSLISNSSPSSTVLAETELTVHCLPGDVFRDLLKNPAFAEFFLKDLGQRLRQLSKGGKDSATGELTTPAGDLISSALVTVSPDSSVADAARAMRSAHTDAALVSSEPNGIITDHDFQVKVLAENLGPDTLVSRVMTPNLKTLPAQTPVHGALLFMLQEGIHHLPLTAEGRIIGLVSATDLLRHQTRNPVFLTRQLELMENTDTLANYRRDAASTVERLFDGGLMVGQVGRIFASVNDTLINRLLKLVHRELGPPPCPYAWLVFGSEGRMEQALITDQDNALVYEEASEGNDKYFAELAQRMVDHLVTAGFPLCPGGYMATNWCLSLDQWLSTMSRWVQSPTPESLMMAGIFFDFRAVAGTLNVYGMEKIILASADNEIFTAHLAREGLRFRPPLNLLRQIKSDEGWVDLKTGGIAPIVAAGRVYGIKAGTSARPTRERFEAATTAGLISGDLAQVMIETYRFLLQIRLRQQLKVLNGGGVPDNRVRLKELSSLEQRHLKDAFGMIRELQEKLGHRFRVGLLG